MAGRANVRFLVHLAGDVPALARAETLAVFAANGTPLTILSDHPRLLDGHAEVFEDEARPILARLGLSHIVARHLFDGVPGRWTEGARDCCLPAGIRFAARYTRIDPDAPWSGSDVEREVGALLAPGRHVELKRPELVVHAFLRKDRIFVGDEFWSSDPKTLDSRHVASRPYFSPVSLEPRVARALVNLLELRPGDVVYDPFCGTGGLLLEAAEMGFTCVGSDLDPEMVEGTRKNLAHYGQSGTLFQSDVGHIEGGLAAAGVERVDGVVADLPYGRSASTGKEEHLTLYRRAAREVSRVVPKGARVVLGLPSREAVDAAAESLSLDAVFPVRAHKSLTRHFAVFRHLGTV